MKIHAAVTVTAVLTLLLGCSSRESPFVMATDHPVSRHESALPATQGSSLKQSLYDQYDEWKGVRYRTGGLSKNGIDCSGFAYITFRTRLGIELPRSTELQADTGAPVKRAELRTGDLVFFKTGRNIRHVGIYLEEEKFLHASTSKGVMISHLDNVYWKAKYWKARRIPLTGE